MHSPVLPAFFVHRMERGGRFDTHALDGGRGDAAAVDFTVA
jgi:hypothetical protein